MNASLMENAILAGVEKAATNVPKYKELLFENIYVNTSKVI